MFTNKCHITRCYIKYRTDGAQLFYNPKVWGAEKLWLTIQILLWFFHKILI